MIVSPEPEIAVRTLYEQVIALWNQRDAAGYAALFAEEGHIVGFDGSVVDGRSAIQAHLSGIFADHVTATYLSKIREIQFLNSVTALVRAVVGMIPPGQADINPSVNAVQSLLAVKQQGTWQIILLQSTPAQFHGRPQLAQELTAELRELLP